ncbi:hypothetical protein E8E13_005980 [Curvularia kusanoi]|uniref:Transmembrane protein n=1 Tax=Curvularia kusanoi TaxID=90978 RepID=A0A9P4T8S9_CURKU|nr:hypothetical protein E8E13_005980 [Curvularia kusanoi]
MSPAAETRSFFRSFAAHFAEARSHPSSPNPVTMKPYPPQYGVMLRRVARSTAFFLPMYFVVLGWPLFPPVLFNGQFFGHGREPWTKV